MLRGNGLKEICKTLNGQGITNNCKRWNKCGLHYLLTNEAYTGTAVWGRTSKGEKATDRFSQGKEDLTIHSLLYSRLCRVDW